MKLKLIQYEDLNARQKENYNFQKVAAKLADYGYNCLHLTDDWQGADFIAVHVDGEQFLKVQLKGRMVFDKKYNGKDIYIAFIQDETFYLYPHDEVQDKLLAAGRLKGTQSWDEVGHYLFPSIPKKQKSIMDEFII